jgi:hypothetical protein
LIVCYTHSYPQTLLNETRDRLLMLHGKALDGLALMINCRVFHEERNYVLGMEPPSKTLLDVLIVSACPSLPQ